MIPDKLELCPYCTRDLGQAEYDGQFCAPCETRPFGGWKRRRPKGYSLSARRELADDLARLLYVQRAGAHGVWAEISDEPRADLVEHAEDIVERLERLGWRIAKAAP